MDRVEVVIVGAGVIGLAVARALARARREVIVVEASDLIGAQTSSRNSEVIHAGIYYPAGSLKARLCVEGRAALYRYCAARGVGHAQLGKLIVATDANQLPALAALRAKAAENGVNDLRMLSAAEAQALEPALACVGALLSPSTGVIDSHGLMLSLQGEAEDHGAAVALNAPLVGGRLRAPGARGGIELEFGGPAPMTLACDALINAAGLGAWDAARALEGFPAAAIPSQRLAKGNYYALSGVRAPFSRLIYPAPEDGGLGVHLTIDLAGQARFGPDVEWLPEGAAADDYSVDPARAQRFYKAIRSYWPALPDESLTPDYAGLRPKLSGPGAPAADFMIQGPQAHGVAGLVNLFGIESPGLTSALSIADYVRDLLEEGRAGKAA